MRVCTWTSICDDTAVGRACGRICFIKYIKNCLQGSARSEPYYIDCSSCRAVNQPYKCMSSQADHCGSQRNDTPVDGTVMSDDTDQSEPLGVGTFRVFSENHRPPLLSAFSLPSPCHYYPLSPPLFGYAGSESVSYTSPCLSCRDVR